MKIGFLADVHVGNPKRFGGIVRRGMNERCMDILQVLQNACVESCKRGYDYLVVNGDLFDTSWPEPQLLSRVQDIMKSATEWPDRRPIEFILIVGNHDQQSNGEGDHALGVLKPYATIVETPKLMRLDPGVVELLCVPYRVGVAKEWMPNVLASLVPKAPGKKLGYSKVAHRLLAVHLGIADEDTAPFLRNAHDAIHVEQLSELMAEHNFNAAFAGNWHEAIVWDNPPPVVQQIGALVPTGWDNPGLEGYGGFACYDTETGQHTHEELPGPRFLHVRSVAEAKATLLRASSAGHILYLKITVGPELVPDALAFVAEAKKKKLLREAEVVADKEEAIAAARTTAMVTRSEDSLAASLAAYVEAMQLDDGIPRQAVLDRANGYLTKQGSA